MDRSNTVRNRRQKNEEINEKRISSKTVDEKKKSCVSYCFLVVIFLVPLLLLPVLPYLRFDNTFKAHYIRYLSKFKLNSLNEFFLKLI
jgi:hypothetical protein